MKNLKVAKQILMGNMMLNLLNYDEDLTLLLVLFDSAFYETRSFSPTAKK